VEFYGRQSYFFAKFPNGNVYRDEYFVSETLSFAEEYGDERIFGSEDFSRVVEEAQVSRPLHFDESTPNILTIVYLLTNNYTVNITYTIRYVQKNSNQFYLFYGQFSFL